MSYTKDAQPCEHEWTPAGCGKCGLIADKGVPKKKKAAVAPVTPGAAPAREPTASVAVVQYQWILMSAPMLSR